LGKFMKTLDKMRFILLPLTLSLVVIVTVLAAPTMSMAARALISMATPSPASSTAGNAQNVSVAVATSNVSDGTDITASLVDGNKNDLSPVINTSGTITGNAAALTLDLPATLAAGDYFVKVIVDGVTGAFYSAYNVASVTVTAGGATMVVNGAALQMNAAVLPTNATNQTVTWSVIPGTGSATISSTGLLTGTAVGTVTVAATANDTSGVIGKETITVASANILSLAGGRGGGVPSVAPEVISVSPNTGSSAGGTTSTITGSNLTGATAVTFGITPATSSNVNGDGTITATAPAEATGAVNVFVTTPAGTSPISPGDQFTYTATTPVPAPAPVKGAIFTDVPAPFWASYAVNFLSSLGYVGGYPDGAFMPDNNITRAEFATIMVKVLKLTPRSTQTPMFSDINTGDWFYQAVETSVYSGIFKGYDDDTFHPNAPISRQEIACVLVQAMGKSKLADSNAKAVTKFVDDQDIAWWSRGYVFIALQQGTVSGYPDGSFKPESDTTRAEACAMVESFLSAHM
jgi:hypothetical protein